MKNAALANFREIRTAPTILRFTGEKQTTGFERDGSHQKTVDRKSSGSFPAVAKQGLPGSLLKLVVYPHERRENEMQRLQRLSTRTLGPGCQTHMACDQLTQDLDAGMQRGCCNLKQKTMASIESLKCTSETRFDLMYVVSSLTSIYIQHRFWTVLYEYERGAGIHGTGSGAEADTSQSRRCELNQGRIIPWNGERKQPDVDFLLIYHQYGAGSIPISTIFRGMNIHKSQLFWGSPGVQGFDTLPYHQGTGIQLGMGGSKVTCDVTIRHDSSRHPVQPCGL